MAKGDAYPIYLKVKEYLENHPDESNRDVCAKFKLPKSAFNYYHYSKGKKKVAEEEPKKSNGKLPKVLHITAPNKSAILAGSNSDRKVFCFYGDVQSILEIIERF